VFSVLTEPEGIADLRNSLAHGNPIDDITAQKLRDEILGFNKIGLLRWLAENLKPHQSLVR
jgi:hypothetical protein